MQGRIAIRSTTKSRQHQAIVVTNLPNFENYFDLLKYCKVINIDKTEIARFIEFLTNKSYHNIYEKVRSPLKLSDRALKKDLNFVKDYFVKLGLEDVVKLMADFGRPSELFKLTGGVHSSAWSDGKEIIRISEDIGRHNCMDKLIGWKLRHPDAGEKAKIILSSGRISSEITAKALRAEIPIMISHSAPTTGAVQLADAYGVTLVGFVRGERFNIYTHPERITE